MEEAKKTISRRAFLETTAVVTGGLIVSYYIPSPMMNKAFAAYPPNAPLPAPNAFIQIAPDNSITIVINKLEMGQGVNTSMAQLIAEELECDWTKIRSVSAGVNPAYNHTMFGTQMAGGSTALISSWDQHRKIGASMREMLKTAAATRWGIPVNQVRAENGFIISKKGKLSYGELAEDAGKLPLPENPPLKNAKDFKIIGTSVARVDAIDKSNGKAIFGIDVRLPGLLYAMIAKPPLAGAKIKSMDEKAARNVSGVTDVVKFADKVAVLAKNTHAAMKGREALRVKWENKTNGTFSSEGLMNEFKAQGKTKGVIAKDTGMVDEALAKAKTKVTAEFEFPFLAHAAMEPMNCTINYDGKKAEIWSGHQMPAVANAVYRLTGKRLRQLPFTKELKGPLS
jgi:isoquinoline 1-oxidoreductase beta subunit